MAMDKMKIGKRIEALRKEKRMTQQDLANKLSLQRSVISYYENGTRVPKVEDLIEISKLFSVTTDYLLGLTDNSTVEYAEIGGQLNLSDSAIDALKSFNEPHFKGDYPYIEIYKPTDILNKILSDFDFQEYILMACEAAYTIDYSHCNELPESLEKEIESKISEYGYALISRHEKADLLFKISAEMIQEIIKNSVYLICEERKEGANNANDPETR